MFNFDLKGKDYRAQFQIRNNAFYGANYIQCPNCGKSFRILKTSLKNRPQFCPYCTQPFSVQDDKFVRESASFSSGRTPTNAQQAFNELFNRGSNAKAPSSPGTIVDVEAEVTDIE